MTTQANRRRFMLAGLAVLALAAFAGVARADELTDAEVRRVDKAAGKLTLKHGEIRNLEMPPMTMIFVVKDKALLERVKAGDKVRFKAAREGGALVVTELQPASTPVTK